MLSTPFDLVVPGPEDAGNEFGGAVRLGLSVGYSGVRVDPRLELVLEADRLGYDSVWVAEAYGSDAVTMLSWYGPPSPVNTMTRSSVVNR